MPNPAVYSKLDELAREIQSIKQSVGDRPAPPSTGPGLPQPQDATAPFTPPDALGTTLSGSAVPSERLAGSHVAVRPSPQVSLAEAGQDPNIGPSLPRALNSQAFSGEDIDHYFQK